MNENDSRVDKLSEKLYSRTRYQEPHDTLSAISEETPEARDNWDSPSIDSMIQSDRRLGERRSYTRSTLNKIFLIAFSFFVVAFLAAGFIYLRGSNFISSKNVDITVEGPISVAAGQPIDLTITIKNSNNADLESAVVAVTFPSGTKDPNDATKALSYVRRDAGVIGSGKDFSDTEHAVLFGETGEVKDVTVAIDYKVSGSTATFHKDKVYEISIGSVPVSMTITKPDNVTSGQSFTTTIALVANSTETLKNVLLRGEYPYGYTYTSSDPNTINSDKNLWNLGDMAPGDTKVIKVTGMLSGQDAEERTFRFSAGIGDPSAGQFQTSLATASETVGINRPSIGLVFSLNGSDSDTYVAPAGKVVTASANVTNNMPGRLSHAKIVAQLSGTALDRFSVTPQQGGFYDSANNQIIWDESNTPSLAALSAGDGGLFSFQFASLTQLAPGKKNQEIDLSTSVSGIDDTNNPVTISSGRVVKIASEVTLSAASLYSKGPFKNTGALPPKAEMPTMFTIELDLKNTQNDIYKPTVTMTLGSNVTWTNQVSPAGDVTYDDNSKKVTWTFNTLASGTGFSQPTRTAYFQVSLSSSIGQVGSIPILINNISFNGQDIFTNTPVTITLPPVTTKTSTDPAYVQGNETVVK